VHPVSCTTDKQIAMEFAGWKKRQGDGVFVHELVVEPGVAVVDVNGVFCVGNAGQNLSPRENEWIVLPAARDAPPACQVWLVPVGPHRKCPAVATAPSTVFTMKWRVQLGLDTRDQTTH